MPMPLRVLLAVAALAPLLANAQAPAAGRRPTVAIAIDVTTEPPARHGLEQLGAAFRAAGWEPQVVGDSDRTTDDLLVLAGTTGGNGPAVRALRAAGEPLPAAPEALVLRHVPLRGRPALVLCGADARGLMYAALDAAARIQQSATRPQTRANVLALIPAVTEAPALPHRAAVIPARDGAPSLQHAGDAEWIRHLDSLAAARFNRVVFDLGTVGDASETTAAASAVQRLLPLAEARGVACSIRVHLDASAAAADTSAAMLRLLDALPTIDGVQLAWPRGAAGLAAAVAKDAQARWPELRLDLEPLDDAGDAANLAAFPPHTRVIIGVWDGQPALPYAPPHPRLAAPPDRVIWRVAPATESLPWADTAYARRLVGFVRDFGSAELQVEAPPPAGASAWEMLGLLVWGRSGYASASAADAVNAAQARVFGAAAPHIASALRHAADILPLIGSGLGNSPSRGHARAPNLIDYAQLAPADPAQFESFGEAAKRILAQGTTAKRTPEATSRALASAAEGILAALRAAEASAGAAATGPELQRAATDLRSVAQIGRFHARRFISATRYQLFKRNLRLAELVAATYEERETVAVWRELVTRAADRRGAVAAHVAPWREELKALEANLKELEEQCCPPDEAVLKERVWAPAPPRDVVRPRVAHTRLRHVRAADDVRLAVGVEHPRGVASVVAHLRQLAAPDASLALPLTPTAGDEFAVTLPRGLNADFHYWLEITDGAGTRTLWPDVDEETPYVITRVAR